MKAKHVRQYRKQETGNLVFVYEVSGTKEEMRAFEDAQGDNLVLDEETGKPLFFTTNYGGPECEIGISSTGNTYLDTSKLDAAAALVERYGGNFGDALAAKALNDIFGPSKSVNTPKSAPSVQEESAGEEGIENM